ncbi:MAG: hypothetical protein PHI12_00400 [Dehalococcoidales bacterium]|nr:hypothetical protein [Dehalococcoidales bacterium]
MKKSGLLKTIIGFGLVTVLSLSIPLMTSCTTPTPTPTPEPTPTPGPTSEPEPTPEPTPEPAEPWKCGYIGAFDTDVGRSALRGTEVAVEELNANGGILGRQIEFYSADSAESITVRYQGLGIPQRGYRC